MTKLVNRAKMYTPTVGTGTITLNSPAVGYQSFASAGVVNSDVIRYAIEDGTAWEIGSGTYTASGTTLTRNPTQSSNGGAAISLTGSAVVYGTATADDIMSLAAIAATKAVTAVDVFVYDTSKDSDGGAWRKRTQHTGWYNEPLNTATRGARREHPAVAVIVAEATKVTIYDGDDPSLPMWMVFNEGNFNNLVFGFNSLSAKNGILCSGNNEGNSNYAGLMVVRFIADDLIGVRNSTYPNSHNSIFGVVNRNSAWPQAGSRGLITSGGGLVSALVNDVAMTVLPNAPIDPATGLQVPTIAVATAVGVSVIKDDGTVVDITASSYTLYTSSVQFDGGDLVFQADSNSSAAISRITYVQAIPNSDFVLTGVDYNRGNADERYIPLIGGAWAGDLTFALGSSSSNQPISFNGSIATEGSTGLNLLSRRPDAPTKGMIAGISSTYNTGWMNGDIKGAYLSDTSATDLVEQASIIPNGDLSAADTFWTINTNSTSQVVSGQLEVTATADFGGVSPQGTTAYEGGWYWVEADLISGTGRFDFKFIGNAGDFPNVNRTGPYSYRGYVMLRESDGYFLPNVRTSVSGTTTVWDNFRMVKVDDDRSVNNNGLIVNGTVTRTFVDEV